MPFPSGGGTYVWAESSIKAEGNKDIYTNAGITTDARGTGSIKTVTGYNNPDRDLEIKWGKDFPGCDSNPVRSAKVYANNITIDTNDVENPIIMNKAVWVDKPDKPNSTDPSFDGTTVLSAQDKIVINSRDDGIYSQGIGKAEVKDFNSLTITSMQGYGIVDNAFGITVKGKDDNSTVTISSSSTRGLERAVIANTYHANTPVPVVDGGIDSPQGTQISIDAGTIKLEAKNNSPAVMANYGGDTHKAKKFNIYLNAAKELTIVGQIRGRNGNVTIGDKKTGKIDLSTNQGDMIYASEGSEFNINENESGSSITGKITVLGTPNDNFNKDNFKKEEIYEKMQRNPTKSTVTINSKGEGFKLEGDMEAGDTNTGNDLGTGTLTLNSTGNNAIIKGNMTTDNGRNKGIIHASILGSGSKFIGNAINNNQMDITLASDANWTGDLTANDGGTANVTMNAQSTWDGMATGNGNISLNDTAKWNITDNSEANSLKFGAESAIASLEGKAQKLTLNQLNGSGTFLMDLKYQDDNVATYKDGTDSDYIIAKGGDGGTHKVKPTDDSSVSGMKDGSKLYFATTGTGSSTFDVNQNVTVMQKAKISDKVLTVKKDTEAGDDNWYLTLADKPEEPDNPVNPINPNGFVPGKVFNSALALWRENDALHKRLGELRYDENEEGLWARFTNMRLERGGSHSFHSNYKNLQIGADKKAVRTNGEWYYGGAFEHLWGKPTYKDGRAEQKLTDFAFYGTNVKANDSFIDYTFKVGRIDSDYDTTYGDHGSFENWAMAIGAEYGKRYTLKDNWTIEPQAQLTYNYLWGDDYTTKNGARVNQDNADSLVGRLGFLFAREIHPEFTTPSRVYFKASILHDFLGDTTSTITDDIKFTDNDDLGDTWYTLGFGTDLRIKDGMQFYFDAEKNFGAEVSMKYRFNAGIRMAF